MTKKQKRYRRILNNQKNVKFGDLISLVEAFGFVLDRIKGSHHTYKHDAIPDKFLVLLPDKNGDAKPYQIKQLLRLIEAYDLRLDRGADADTTEAESDNDDN